MNGDSVLSSRSREEGSSRFQGVQVRRTLRAQALLGGVVLGVVTVLHLALIVYLTIPPTPIDEEHTSLPEDGVDALKLRFVEAAPRAAVPSVLSSPLPGAHTRPSSVARTRPAAVSPKAGASAEASVAPSDDRHADTEAVAPAYDGPSTPYGNPLLRGGQAGSSGARSSRLPGAPDDTFVSTIALKEPPSAKQIVGDTGHFMNCSQVRIARFLSASEMDKRHITTQELDKAFTEFGCR